MTESIRNEAVYTLTGDQLKQFAHHILAEFIESEEKTDAIFFKKTCGKSEAARYLKVNRLTIYNMIKDGRLKTNSSGKVLVQSIIDYEGARNQNERAKLNKRGNKVYV